MAERVLISLEDIDLTFGGKPLFEGLRVHICDKDRICLIGKKRRGENHAYAPYHGRSGTG